MPGNPQQPGFNNPGQPQQQRMMMPQQQQQQGGGGGNPNNPNMPAPRFDHGWGEGLIFGLKGGNSTPLSRSGGRYPHRAGGRALYQPKRLVGSSRGPVIGLQCVGGYKGGKYLGGWGYFVGLKGGSPVVTSGWILHS